MIPVGGPAVFFGEFGAAGVTPARATVVVAVALLLSSTGSGVLLETKAVSLKSVVCAALTDTIKVDVVSGRLRRSSQSPT